MKTTRILSLLFSISQFLLVLKLIEYVRGEETGLAAENRVPKHFFVAPGIQRRKKNKPWLTTSSSTEDAISATDTSNNSSELGMEPYKFQKKIMDYDQANNENLFNNVTTAKINGSIPQTEKIEKIGVSKQEKRNSSSTSTSNANNVPNMARLCPTCANGECDGNVQGSSFPIIPIIVSVIAAVVWFFIFLWIVIGNRRTDTTTTNKRYGYGGDNFGGSIPSSTYNMARSINDFLGSEEIGNLSQFVLKALEKFS